jgi:hypothetical protein
MLATRVSSQGDSGGTIITRLADNLPGPKSRNERAFMYAILAQGLHLGEATVHKQFRTCYVAAIVGGEKNHSPSYFIGCT